MFSNLFDVRGFQTAGLGCDRPRMQQRFSLPRWTKHLSKASQTAWGCREAGVPAPCRIAMRLWPTEAPLSVPQPTFGSWAASRGEASPARPPALRLAAWRGFIAPSAVPESEGSPWLQRGG